MLVYSAVIFSVLVTAWCDLTFPPGFKFGAATSAYQIEGHTNISESIWHRFTSKNPSPILDGRSGKIACDSYRLWRDDVNIAHELGLDFYRFSISWGRLLPTGLHDQICEDGKKYYSDLIDGLLEKGIKPMVTLYHWDLPQRLQDFGGWTNPLISDWFADYARVVFNLYGDRVGIWITINEPLVHCQFGYGIGDHPPGVKDPDYGYYLCIRHMAIGHAKVWRIYDEEFRGKYGGKISYTNLLIWFDPHTDDDQEISELANLYVTGLYSHPVYSKEGGWPPEVERILAEYSKKKGYKRSVLPPFTEDEKDFIRGTFDFYSFNYYAPRSVRKARPGEEISQFVISGIPPLGAVVDRKPEWPLGSLFYFSMYPKGFRLQMVWLKQQYGDLEYVIAENGYPDTEESLDDKNRIQYLRDHMEQMLLAIKEDGVNVTHYTVWSLMDNFEWGLGYTQRYGLYAVDFTSPKRTRTARASARYYASVIKERKLDATTKIKRITDEL